MSGLSRSLTMTNATAMVVGTIIGASIFVQPSEIARHLQTPTQIMLVWAACGVLTFFGALVCAELSSAFPQTGGFYVFMRDTFSPLAGFLWGWAMFWTMHTGIIAAIAVVFARYTAHFIPTGDIGVRAIAVTVILALSALNYVGVKAGSRVQTALTAAKLVAIIAIVIAGFAFRPETGTLNFSAGAAGTETGTLNFSAGAAGAETGTLNFSAGAAGAEKLSVPFLLAMVAGLFAYGGWHMVTYTAGETIVPTRTIPIALVAGVGIVTVCYIALNLVYLSVLPVDAVRSSTRIAADAADAVVGRGGSSIMAGLVMMSSLGGLTGIVLTGPRVYYSMAQDGIAFRWLGAVHPVYRTPSNAIAAQGVWASVLAATGAYRELFTRVIYTEWLFFALMAAGLFVLRRRPGYEPRYRAWGYPVVPAIFITASLAIVVNQLISDPKDASLGLGMVAIGAPIYYLWHAHHRLP